MGQIKQYETNQQERKGDCHGAMDLHGRDPHDERVQSPTHKKPPDILCVGMVNVEKVEDEDDSECNPESSVRYKSAVANRGS